MGYNEWTEEFFEVATKSRKQRAKKIGLRNQNDCLFLHILGCSAIMAELKNVIARGMLESQGKIIYRINLSSPKRTLALTSCLAY